jgi:hypothetical protein
MLAYDIIIDNPEIINFLKMLAYDIVAHGQLCYTLA